MRADRLIPKLVLIAALFIHQPSLAADQGSNPDDTQIRAQLSALASSVTGKKIDALSSLWAKDATYIDADGDVFKGREALHKRFDTAKESTTQPIEMVPDEIRMLSATVAEAEGNVRLKDAGAASPETRFSIVFTKEDGKWLIASAAETPIALPTSAEYLKDLSWLIGDWTADHEGRSLRMHGAWQGHKNFIHLNYEVGKPGEPVQEDSEIIGFDPHTQQVVSWYFDSTGSIGQGTWQKNGSQWQINVSKVSRDGVTMTARDVISVKDPNSYSWQSINRTADGVPVGDIAELQVVRAK
jgi:uncharacterized protein (TIGR02246 family)